MAKNKRQWGSFRVENRKVLNRQVYDLQVDIGRYPEKGIWKTLDTYVYFRNARRKARELDEAFRK